MWIQAKVTPENFLTDIWSFFPIKSINLRIRQQNLDANNTNPRF